MTQKMDDEAGLYGARQPLSSVDWLGHGWFAYTKTRHSEAR